MKKGWMLNFGEKEGEEAILKTYIGDERCLRVR